MIVGLITLIALLVTRLPGTAPPAPVLPARITLPDGERARAATFGNGWIAVVTENDEILILDARTGELRQRIRIDLTDR
ncbi:hypothetical protein LV82_02614 [Albidovulum inexpectatum]|uniref:Uncharacterized protein n=2 Tax=Albidovulum inexpectatum TaxID=196587 RepID=A0A2S5JE90_9RHOB|nr:hypothetical protein LV82_02614 [Albidovulum inexpectatum]